MENKIYSLPELPYAYNALSPAISEEQLKLHHQKHHQAYINSANSLLEKIRAARTANSDFDIKSAAKEFSFNLSGHILHMMFWKNLRPRQENNSPTGEIAKMIEENFGDIDRFKKEFSQTALFCEGSGWAALALDPLDKQLFILQIEKHNLNLIPQLKLLLVIDVWEHAYYLDYKNSRLAYIEAIWSLVDWTQAEKRLTGRK